MLVSIIVPVYNVEDFLDRCLESLIAQTYKETEIILVDDGSTDHSGQICDEWTDKYPEKIVVIHKENGGLSDARNVGLKNAHGQFISFVDSDDFVSRDMIHTMVTDIKRHNVEIACVGYLPFMEEKEIGMADPESEIAKVYDSFAAIKQLFSSDGYGNFAWNKLYRIDLFKNITFPVGRKMEDLGTTYLLMERCSKIYYNTRKLYYYFQREGSILHNPDKFFYIDKLILSLERYLYLEKRYGDFRENIEFVLTTIFECYPYIADNKLLCNKINTVIDELWRHKRYEFRLKRQFKLWVFKYYKGLYLKVWGENDKH